jgi:hypothetical protein
MSALDRAGVYLTDEVFLYRVAGSIAGDGDGIVELEDCYSLEVVRVPEARLRARRLRVVLPESGLETRSIPRPAAVPASSR